jgi:transaldolase / glucose-6-phosphate isomerase
MWSGPVDGVASPSSPTEEICSMTPEPDVVLRLEPVRDALDELTRRNAVERLHKRDASLWSDAPDVQAKIADRLGWLDAVAEPDGEGERLAGFAEAVASDSMSRVVLAGMGGSSLAPEVLARVFEGQTSGAQLQVLDSTHPAAVHRLLDDADLSNTLVLVSSKSGTTEETRCFAARARAVVPGPHHLAAITDPGSALESEAFSNGYRAVFRNPPDIGGRFSALSLFGMVPAALLGLDTTALWKRAAEMLERCRMDVEENPGARLGAFMAGLARQGRDKLTVIAPERLAPLGDWIEQLVAESTGKQGLGVIPVVGEPTASPGSYGDDRAFVAMRWRGEGPDALDALTEAGHPVLQVDLGDALDVAAEFVRWEVATAFAGALLDVNPFDEPNVSESKANTGAILREVEDGGELPPPEDGDVAWLLAGLAAGDYLTVQAYLEPTAAHAEALHRLRIAVRDRTRVATTVGWGPRFLHSTGQLHKGGPGTVAALQIVDSSLWQPASADVEIPGRPYDFATLVRAQAVGDLRSLRDHGRRVVQTGVEPGQLDGLVDRLIAALP